MTIRRIAQTCALVTLGCLAVLIGLGWTSSVVDYQSEFTVPALVPVMMMQLLQAIAGVLAIIAPTLLLVELGRAQQWVRFRVLLGLTITILLLSSLTPLVYLLAAYEPSFATLVGGQQSDSPALSSFLVFLLPLVLTRGPSALLALCTLVFGVTRTRRQSTSLFASNADSNLELRIEPIVQRSLD